MAVTTSDLAFEPTGQRTKVVPGSLQCPWQIGHTDPQQEENGGSRVINPQALTDADIYELDTGGLATLMLARLKYQATTVTQNPKINVFGKDSNGVWMQLKNALGQVDIELVPTVGSDLTDGTDSFTPEHEIDLKGSQKVLITMMQQLTGTGLSSDQIWVKFL